MTPSSFAAVTCLALLAAAPASNEVARSPRETVVEFVAAFARHDLPALLSFTDPDVEWLSIAGSSVSVETRGREALEASMRSYFDSCPTCKATVEVAATQGNFVAAVETATWQAQGTERAQSSLSVYEFADGKIRRVWYYPAAER